MEKLRGKGLYLRGRGRQRVKGEAYESKVCEAKAGCFYGSGNDALNSISGYGGGAGGQEW